jgi:predicted transcriptional regulator
MQVDTEIREQLSYFCMVTKQTQERAANQALREMLQRAESDPAIKERMDRAKALKEEMAALYQPLTRGAGV